jgi:nucleoside-diphosphate-sugar epimerase
MSWRQPESRLKTLVLPPARVLAVGATGSIGRLVAAAALKQGYEVRALSPDKVPSWVASFLESSDLSDSWVQSLVTRNRTRP